MSDRSPSPERLLRRARRARVALWLAVSVIALDLLWTVVGTALMGGLVDLAGWTDWWDPGVQWLTGAAGIATFAAALYVVRCQRELLRWLQHAGVTLLSPGVTLSTFAWIVPIANLFLPLRSFRQIAVVAGPGREASLRRALDTWWALWLGGTIANRIASGLHKTADEPGLWLVATAFALVGGALLVWAGLLFAGVLPRLAAEQAELRMLLDLHPGERPSFLNPLDLALWWHRAVLPRTTAAPPALQSSS